MGTGWRRAFCTTIHGDPESRLPDKQQRRHSSSPSPRSCTPLAFFSGSSNPSTPRSHNNLFCHSQSATPTVNNTPRLQCTTTTASTPKSTQSPKTKLSSNPSSPRSPLKLSLFKNSFKFRSSCGVCLNSVKSGQGTAIYTAECSHAFHFLCIAAHVRKHGTLICPVPVCNAAWKDGPFLSLHKNPSSLHQTTSDININTATDKSHTNSNSTAQHLKNTPTDDGSASKVLKHVELRPQQHPKHSEILRTYNDDEPLLSPTLGSQIISIPEADEKEMEDDQDNDVEEFQGFFVNPVSSSSSAQFKMRDSRNVQVKLIPECALVSASRTHETYALVLRIKAPSNPTPKTAHHSSSSRAPIDLVTVLDVSGSMTGDKLHMLKRAMRLVISSLGPADRLSIVAFSSTTKRLLPLRRMTPQGQRSARHIVDRLVCGQGTRVSEALRKATKVLEDRRERNPVASVMLLSDGQDEKVQTEAGNQNQHPSTHVSSTRFAHVEIPVHSFSFGDKGGYGFGYGYGSNQEPAEDAFTKCVGGLLSLVVQDLRIQLGFSSGSAPAEICAVYSCHGRPTVLKADSIRLGDLYAEEERELLVELRVPESAWSSGAPHELTVRCSYKDPATHEVVYGREQHLLVPPLLSVRSTGSRIERLRSMFIGTRAIAESKRLIQHNDLTSAHQLLASARALLMQTNSKWDHEFVHGLEIELAEVQWRMQQQKQHYHMGRSHHQEQDIPGMIQRRRGADQKDVTPMGLVDENGEPLTPTSAWRAAEKLAKVAMMKKPLNETSDLHGFENARF